MLGAELPDTAPPDALSDEGDAHWVVANAAARPSIRRRHLIVVLHLRQRRLSRWHQDRGWAPHRPSGKAFIFARKALKSATGKTRAPVQHLTDTRALRRTLSFFRRHPDAPSCVDCLSRHRAHRPCAA